MRKHCKRNERQATPPCNPIEYLLLFMNRGNTLQMSLSAQFAPMCCTELVCIFIPFHIQETKGQAAQHMQKKAPPFQPSLLICIARIGFFFFGLQTFIISLCSQELLSSNKLNRGCTETNKEATPSPESLQWNLTVP